MTAREMNRPAVRTPVRAVVHVGNRTTTYLRAGHGPVVVIAVDDLEREAVLTLVDTLSKQFLVFAASPLARDAGKLHQWFHDFVEGLGLAEAHLLVHASASALLQGEPDNA